MKLRFLAVVTLLATVSTGVAQEQRPDKRGRWRPIREQSIGFSPPANVPADGAGCLVVGYHILTDGSVSVPRIMQGVYTGNITDAVQKQFADDVIAASRLWKFRYEKGYRNRLAAFNWTVVGFHGDGGRAVQTVLGLESQNDKVRNGCAISDLGAWGSAHAISIEEASAAKDDRILLPYAEPVESVWADASEKMPPRYPPIAYKAGVGGCILVGMLIGREGRPEKFRITKAALTRTAPKIRMALEEAAMRAASAWRFLPGPDNPERVPAFVQIPVDYGIDGPSRTDCQPVDPKQLTEPKG